MFVIVDNPVRLCGGICPHLMLWKHCWLYRKSPAKQITTAQHTKSNYDPQWHCWYSVFLILQLPLHQIYAHGYYFHLFSFIHQSIWRFYLRWFFWLFLSIRLFWIGQSSLFIEYALWQCGNRNKPTKIPWSAQSRLVD